MRALLVLALGLAACGGRRGEPRAVPAGSGWICGARGDGSNFCVRDAGECTIAAKTCAPHNVAHCFTYAGADGSTHFSCKPTPSECEQQAERFARDERDVSSCALRR